MANHNDAIERFKRISYRAGKALVAGDFALSGGFGSTASVAVLAGSTDACFQIVVTSAGTGQGASPTCILTFADGAWKAPDGSTVVPFAMPRRNGGDQPTVGFNYTATATALTLTLQGTPVAGETYTETVFLNG
jgi:hypothetical protein